MRPWTVAWLLPVGLLVTVVLISLSNPSGYLAVLVWGWVVFPYGLALLRSRTRRGRRDAHGLDDLDTNYWRTKVR
jgi:hypothetical protein